MKTEPDGDELSQAEQFANSYYYLIEALKTLAAHADAQCYMMGNYNVAWEIKQSVSAGLPLLSLPSQLTEQERDGIAGIVAALEQIPSHVLKGDTTSAGNARAMNHPCWIPLRARAAALLNLLGTATARNEAFLKSGGRGSVAP